MLAAFSLKLFGEALKEVFYSGGSQVPGPVHGLEQKNGHWLFHNYLAWPTELTHLAKHLVVAEKGCRFSREKRSITLIRYGM